MHNPLDRLFQSAEDVYSATKKDSPDKRDAELLLGLRGWFVNSCDFDPMTGQALPQDLCGLLGKIRESIANLPFDLPSDRVGRVLDHTKEALLSIVANPREKVLREHAMLPVFAAREFDSASVQWLSRQPGRNVREKLVGKPYLKSISRRMSSDTSENRLLKAFITKLEQLLLARDAVFNGQADSSEDELLAFLQRWLRGNDSSEIGEWTNLPPNNTLLQNKNYRKVWDSWLCLQSLDENITVDHKRLKLDFLTVLLWSVLATFEESEGLRLVQQPCLFGYDDFSIEKSFSLAGRYYPEKKEGEPRPFQIRLLEQENLQICVGDKSVSITVNDEGLAGIVFYNEEKAKKSKKIECLLSSVSEITKMTENFLFDGEIKAELSTVGLAAANKFTGVVLDLCSARPIYVEKSCSEQFLPFRLVRQDWPSVEYGDLYVDCGVAKAIKLSPNIRTISILDLFSDKSEFSSPVLSSAAVGFSKKLSKFFKTEKLVYLVPDSTNEFSLENLRKSINFYFPDSTPLPRSIAAVFDWQNSEAFSESGFNHGDIVFVFDRSVDGLSLTPLVGYKSAELSKSVPASRGVYWERQPTTILKDEDPFNEIIKDTLEKDGCHVSKEIASLIDVDELLNESAPLSWVDDKNRWYEIGSNVTENIRQLTKKVELPWDDIRNDAETILEGQEKSVYILSADERLQKSSNSNPFVWVDTALSLVCGGQILSVWQAKAGKVPFWKDHLPDLSFKIPVEGRWGQFDVVKGARVTPQKGKKVQVPVERPFTLPAGRSYFSFQLLQGSRGQALKYMAYLKSPAFPLQNDTVCTLKMVYTYGADDPYQLEFIPQNTDEAGFKSVRVEWRELSSVKNFDLSFPRFPKRHSWDYFERYPKKDSADVSNLLEWLVETLDRLPQYRDSINKGVYTSKQLRARIRFPVFTIWNQEHSLSDVDAPSWFRDSVQDRIGSALSMFGSKNVTKEMKAEILFFLSGLHKDAPEVVPVWLMETSKSLEHLQIFYKHIAIAIGDCNLEWQKELLRKSISLIDSDNLEISTLGLQILSLALWRSENLIYQLTAQELKKILDCTLNSLEESFSDFKKKLKNRDFYFPYEIVKLELVLALVRTRSFDDEAVKGLLLPQQNNSERFVKIIDEFVHEICSQDIAFRSFVSLQVDKPPAFYKTPDLLYALRMYLTGDSGANTIQVTGVSYQD